MGPTWNYTCTAGTLGLGMSRNVSGISNSLLQWCCDGNAMFAFSATKGPVKELRLSFMLGEKYVKKIFYYFQGLRTLKCHRTKRLNCANYRSKWPLQKTFSSFTPLSPGFSRVFAPPLPPARISRILSVGGRGGGFFLEQPNSRKIFGNVRLAFKTILENLQKVVGNLQKRRHQCVYIIKKIITR